MARFDQLHNWLAWLETLHPCEIDLGLKRVFSVACDLGIIQPTRDARYTGSAINANGTRPTVITIAGTNGKGSCVKALESIFIANAVLDNHIEKAASYSQLSNSVTVASFTSPHILQYNERIKLNGLPLCDSDICILFAAIDQARGQTSLTYFEFAALAALLAMHRSNSPIWVLEVGLGGRLDAVNIVDCTVAVITSIGLDHQAWLGDTLDEIAQEKGGIMRANTPVVFASQKMPNVLNEMAIKLNAKPYLQGTDYTIHTDSYSQHTVCTANTRYAFSNFGMPIESLSAAIMAYEILQLPVDIQKTQQVLNSIYLEGRFEIIRYRNAVFILDVAHNIMAVSRFAENLLAYQNRLACSDSMVAICAMMADKDIEESLKPLSHLVSQWVCCDIPNNTRAQSASRLAHIVTKHVVKGKAVSTQPSVTLAIQNMIDQQNTDDKGSNKITLYPVFGSFFTVSAAKIALSQLN